VSPFERLNKEKALFLLYAGNKTLSFFVTHPASLPSMPSAGRRQVKRGAREPF